MIQIAPVLGVLAALVGVAGNIPYLRDTFRRSTEPHRGTWLIWGVLAIVVCLSQRADGASWSLVMAATHVVLNTAIFVLAIRLGTGGVNATDTLMITVAAAGLAGWLLAVIEPALLLYPIYYCLVNGALALLIGRRRAVKCQAQPLVAA
jgi:hypothetical protein